MAGSGRRDADAVLIAALAAGASKPDAATAAGVGERTVYRRLEDADFRRRVQAARADLIEAAVGKLADTSAKAVTTLGELLDAESESVRLGAAKAVIELGAKLREQQDIEARLAALEERLDQQGGHRWAS